MYIRKLLMIVVIIMYSFTAMAQYTYGEPVESTANVELRKTRFGLFVAPNSSWMKPTAARSNDGRYLVTSEGSKVGYSWGLMIDHFFAENYGISTGVQLATTGGKILAEYDPTKFPTPGPDNIVKSASFDYRLQYFEVPFGLKLMSDNLAGGLRIFGNLGVTAAINISKKATYSVTYTDTAGTGLVDEIATGENEKLRNGVSIIPVLFQMNLGGGIEYQFTPKMSLYMGLFFNNGFAPDVTSPKDINMGYKGTFTDGNIRLNNIALKVGLFF